MTAHICGIDIGKTVFYLVDLSKEGHIVTRKRLARGLLKYGHDLTTLGQYTVQANKRIPKKKSVVESIG